jgi:hypothetical protein
MQIRPVLTNFIISATDGHPDHPQSTPNQPLQGESNFGDSSGPIFSIYSEATKELDDKMVDRWQKDADGILIFVSPRVRIYICLVHELEHYRPVCSPLLSLHSLL